MITRRGLLAAGGLGLLGGCGFHPTYGGGTTGQAQASLAGIIVDLLPNRSGQLLRLALQRRFEGSGLGVAKTAELYCAYQIISEGVGIRSDSGITRNRYIGSASYTLYSLAVGRRTITSGSARVLDGLDIVNEQYFAADLESEQIERRLAEAVADRITTQLASFYARQKSVA